MVDRLSILRRLSDIPGASAQEASTWLAEEDAQLRIDGPAHVNVQYVLLVWGRRFRNLLRQGRHLHGAEALLLQIALLPPETKLEQFSFSSLDKAGSVFFDQESSHFVGYVMVETISLREADFVSDELTPAVAR